MWPAGTYRKMNLLPQSNHMENRTFAVVMTVGARRGGHGAMPPPWLCNKVLKPNFQLTISQANNGCSLLLLILAKPQLLDISCGNIFAASIVTALTACSFSIKKCAKMRVLYVKIVKIRWRLGATPLDPLGLQRLGVSPPGPRWYPPPPLCQILGCAIGDDLCYFSFPKQGGPRLQKFFQCGPSCKKFVHP